MKRLIFVNVWSERKSAWSGTPNGLFVALSKKASVHEIDACVPCKGSLERVRNLFDTVTCHLLKNRIIEKRIAQSLPKDSCDPVFVFGEYLTAKIEDTYCFQDLTMDYLLRLRQQKNPAARFGLDTKASTLLAMLRVKRARIFYQRCAGIFTMSEWLRQDMINEMGISADRVHCVGGGSNIDVTKIDTSHKNGSRFLFVGKEWERKNGELVVAAFKKIQEMYPERHLELYIAGPTEKPMIVEEVQNVKFLGMQSPENLIEYYNLCDYFVMPSKFEAYGLVFAEALSFGLPCIGKNFCAMPEFIKDDENGYLIEGDDVDELAHTMKKMLINGERLKENVRLQQGDIIKRYSWDSVADRILAVIEKDKYCVMK